MRISDWSSDVCSSDLPPRRRQRVEYFEHPRRGGVEARPLVATQRSAHPPGLAQRRLLRRAVGTQTAAPFDVAQAGSEFREFALAALCPHPPLPFGGLFAPRSAKVLPLPAEIRRASCREE